MQVYSLVASNTLGSATTCATLTVTGALYLISLITI